MLAAIVFYEDAAGYQNPSDSFVQRGSVCGKMATGL